MRQVLLLAAVIGAGTALPYGMEPVGLVSRAAHAETARPAYSSYKQAREAARVNAEAERYSEARADLAAAVALAKNAKDRSAAQLRIGETYKLENSRDEARAAWEKVLTMEGAPADDRWAAEMAIGASLLDDNQPAKARIYFERVENNKGYKLDATMRIFLGIALGSTYQREERYAEAREQYDKVLNRNYKGPMAAPALQTAQLSYAGTYFGEGDFARARAAYEKIATAPIDEDLPEPEQASMRINRQQAAIEVGNCFGMEKNYPAARAAFEAVIADAYTSPPLKEQAEARLNELLELEKKAQNQKANPKRVQ